jgi:hypothetical protein
MTMLLGPSKAVLAGEATKHAESADGVGEAQPEPEPVEATPQVPAPAEVAE